MNEEVLAASALLVQTASVVMVLLTFLQLSNVNPTQVCSAPAGRQVISTNLVAPQANYDFYSAFEKADRLLEQKRTNSQFHYMRH
jgi:hypothetical protein